MIIDYSECVKIVAVQYYDPKSPVEDALGESFSVPLCPRTFFSVRFGIVGGE